MSEYDSKVADDVVGNGGQVTDKAGVKYVVYQNNRLAEEFGVADIVLNERIARVAIFWIIHEAVWLLRSIFDIYDPRYNDEEFTISQNRDLVGRHLSHIRLPADLDIDRLVLCNLIDAIRKPFTITIFLTDGTVGTFNIYL